MNEKMAALIQRIARQALATFMTGETSAFSSNFERLKTLVSEEGTILNDKNTFLRLLWGIYGRA